MKHFASLILLLFVFSLSSQDIIKTKNGELTITPIYHGSLVLEYDDMVIYVDPHGGWKYFEGQKLPNVILITDIHGDHFNKEMIETIEGKIEEEGSSFSPWYYVPQAVLDKDPDFRPNRAVTVLANGESDNLMEVYSVRAIPMYNLPETEDSRHPKGRGNGYVLDIDGTTVYISGDTEDIQEMRELKKIDVAFICMNLPYTMDVDQAADAVSQFKPKVVYPFHYRGQGGLSDVQRFKELVNDATRKVDVRLRNWYPEK